MQRLLGELRRADERYGLIGDGDRIAVGLSGGKDSLALLALLSAYRRFSPHRFELAALTVKIGEPFRDDLLRDYCRSLDVPFYLRENDLLPALREEKNPCSLCARLRRGTLANMARETGCGKLALGHHRDDVMETLVMSALYEGRFTFLPPRAVMERTGITVIRPLIDIPEEKLSSLAARLSVPIVKNPCPVDGKTARQDVKLLLRDMEKRCPGSIEHLCTALKKQREIGNEHV